MTRDQLIDALMRIAAGRRDSVHELADYLLSLAPATDSAPDKMQKPPKKAKAND